MHHIWPEEYKKSVCVIPVALAVVFVSCVSETVDLAVAPVSARDTTLVGRAEELVVEGASLRVAPLLVFSLMAIQVTVTLLHGSQALARPALELIEGTCDISCKELNELSG